jgi:hypothetical protein
MRTGEHQGSRRIYVRSFRRGAVRSGLAVTLLLGMVLIPSSLGAQPKTGLACWGPQSHRGGCGGDSGPVGGAFQVVGGKVIKVESFIDSQKCLGNGKYGLENEVQIPTFTVSSTGTFSFNGKAKVPEKTGLSVPVKVIGNFVTPTLAQVALTITYKTCGTYHLSLEYP